MLAANADEIAQGFEVHLEDEDVTAVMHALLNSERRIQKINLSTGSVWIKRQGTEKPSWGPKAQSFLAKLLPYSFMRPSPMLDPIGMMRREVDTMRLFEARGFPVPQIIYASPTAVVLEDVGLTIAQQLDRLEKTDVEAHDALLIGVAAGLGDLHAAGLCHGRPHVRDFYMLDGRLGFMDFEETPQAVMPLETAQARDLWLLFLPLSQRAIKGKPSLDAAYAAWASRAPHATIVELRRLVRILSRFLPLARLIGRVRMGSDLQRFIEATDYLKNAVETEAAG
ncbi:lipopolysaccharide kinase InaA family protein [Rhizobium sp. Leaf262]|uniref:lipopolysaccharide kinase InaA family protein n=1 Tax=Rhizobium sp. Leaf262 TaxID=1736312 RepID=UPI000A82844C|nr:lipopolysaccharide kinase InaA family protein [Rhizobium sp. Leaf262]